MGEGGRRQVGEGGSGWGMGGFRWGKGGVFRWSRGRGGCAGAGGGGGGGQVGRGGGAAGAKSRAVLMGYLDFLEVWWVLHRSLQRLAPSSNSLAGTQHQCMIGHAVSTYLEG